MTSRYAFVDAAHAFIVRYGDRSIDDWRRDEAIAIGWSDAIGLDRESDWERFKDIIRIAYQQRWSSTERSVSMMASSAFQFIRAIQKDDLVIVPVPGAFWPCKVVSDIYYDEKAGGLEDSAWKRHVKWLSDKPVPRSYCSNTLQRRLKVRQTCVDVSGIKQDILQALHRNRPVSFNEEVMEKSYESVATALRKVINDRKLEDLVMMLAQVGGARAEISPRTSRLPGDVDVIATYDLGIGNEESTIKVGYQVKQHDGTSDSFGIQQLLDRMDAVPELVRGCFVTTAHSLDEEAQRLADENGIIVIKEQDLVKWILISGLGALQESAS